MKITKVRLKQIIKEEASRILNERITTSDIERMLPASVVRNTPGVSTILQRRVLAAKMSKEELAQKIQAARIKDGEHPRQFFKRQDKTDVKKMVKDELEKLLKKKEMKDQISELTKKILKKLYKDLSLEHPYIIDRIKI